MNKKNLSIFLSVLICSMIFTMLSYLIYTNTKSAYIGRKERNPFHAVIDNSMSYEKAKSLEGLDSIKSIGLSEEPKAAKIGNQIVSIVDESDTYYSEAKESLLMEGRIPKTSDEIILSNDIKKVLDLKIGDTISMEFGNRTVNGETINPTGTRTQEETFERKDTKDYKIVGFTKTKYSETRQIYFASSVISNFDSNYYVHFNFKNPFQAFEVKEEIENYVQNNIDENAMIEINTELLRFFGIREEDGFYLFRLLFELLTVLGIAIVLALMIKNVFNIWAIYKIRELSMYKSIGATNFQIYTLLLKQSLLISLVPAILGQVTGYYFTRQMYKHISEIERVVGESTVAFQFNGVVSICIFILTIVTILLAVISPARKISKINIIEGLSGNISFKEYKKKFGKTLFHELSLNNRKTLRPQMYVMVAGLFMILGMDILLAVNQVNHEYSHYESDYNIRLNYFTDSTEYPKVFDEILQNIENEKSFISARKFVYLKYDEMEFSDEFQKIGFNEYFDNSYNIKEKRIDANLYGYEESAFHEIGGTGNEVLFLNRVQKDPIENIMGAEKIPYFKDVKQVSIQFLEDGREYKLEVDKEIQTLKDFETGKMPYEISIITSLNNYQEILNFGRDEYREKEEKFPSTSYSLELKVPIQEIQRASESIESIVKNGIHHDESYSLFNDIRIQQFKENEDQTMLFLTLTIVIAVIFLNIANSYSTTNLSFFNRKTEIGTLISCGMEQKEVEKRLKKEILVQLTTATFLSVFLTLILIFVLTKLQPIATFEKIVKQIPYGILFVSIGIIFIGSYSIYLLAMRKVTRENIIELIKVE